jgi:alpha-tubulin suppressor-like RCC1 family protein
VTGISAGWFASVATRINGISAVTSVWTWGNSVGELGPPGPDQPVDPRTGDQEVPAYIAGISAGATSPRPWAPNGSVWSWGSDDNGQLGVVLTSSPATRPVNTIAAGSGIVQLAAGAEHMLALKSDGAVVARATTSTARSATARRQNISGRYRSPA